MRPPATERYKRNVRHSNMDVVDVLETTGKIVVTVVAGVASIAGAVISIGFAVLFATG